MTIKYEKGPACESLQGVIGLQLRYPSGSSFRSSWDTQPLKARGTLTPEDDQRYRVGEFSLYLELARKFQKEPITTLEIAKISEVSKGARVKPTSQGAQEGALNAGETLFIGKNGKVVYKRQQAFIIVTGA